MERVIVSEKQLIHLKLVYEIHAIADSLLDKGKYSKAEIYYKFVAIKVPICINTFRKMLKEDGSAFPRLAEEYQKRVYNNYLNHLERLSQKRKNKGGHS